LGRDPAARELCALVMAFALDPRLEADTINVASLAMCELLIMNDARYPWAILAPRIEGARELHDLSATDGAAVWAEVMAVAKAIGAWLGVEKVNVGALGNIVSQLHVHVIGRNAGDPAWPSPVWGHSARVPYDGGGEEALARHLLEVCVKSDAV
jgi:diadenosine tetraphosphate (Ap4A) HIT family hydrolase